MDASSFGQLIALIASSILCAILSGMEMILDGLKGEEIKDILEEGGVGADRVTYFLRNPRRCLATAFLAKGLCLVLITFLCLSLFGNIHSPMTGKIISFAIAAATIALLGEIIPYNYTRNRSIKSVVTSISVLRILSYCLFFLVEPFMWIGGIMLKASGGTPQEMNGVVSEEDLEALEIMTEGEGVLADDEREMIHRIWELPDTIVREIMVPRTDMVCLDIESDITKILTVAVESGHSRIPVYSGTVDNIVGILYVKDLLKCWLDQQQQINLTEIIREPYFVPETKNVKDLFSELRLARLHIAITLDEYGGTAGMITMEDILEEIVGDIQDEYDTEDNSIVKLEDGTYSVDAKTDIHDLNEQLELDMPANDVESVGGLVIEALGRVPAVGESVVIGRIKLTVLEADERRIIRVGIEVINNTEEEE